MLKFHFTRRKDSNVINKTWLEFRDDDSWVHSVILRRARRFVTVLYKKNSMISPPQCTFSY